MRQPARASTGTRDRIVTAAAELFRQRGYAATGIKAVLGASDAPYGSLYHFFPGGKQQLGVTVIETGADVYLQLVQTMYDEHGDDVLAATRQLFEVAADLLESTGFADACPIATIAGEIAGSDEPMRLASAKAFSLWINELDARFQVAGLSPDASHSLAVELFCLIEGAFLLARTTRDATPVRLAGQRAVASLESGLVSAHSVEAR
jgi:TetR/AcrR family transcriptional regulator, lmrAB and yxaGH operons repressor